MTRVLLVRHAQSEWNAQGRWQGQADPPLSAEGRAQAAVAASRLDEDFTRIASSDLRRAAQTAAVIADALGIDAVTEHAGMREIDVGEWSGLTREEIDERWPGLIDEWRAGRLDATPGGENREAFRERIVTTTRELAALGAEPLLVVTHAAAIGMFERHVGVHPGGPVHQLMARWFEVGDEITALSGRVSLTEQLPD